MPKKSKIYVQNARKWLYFCVTVYKKMSESKSGDEEYRLCFKIVGYRKNLKIKLYNEM